MINSRASSFSSGKVGNKGRMSLTCSGVRSWLSSSQSTHDVGAGMHSPRADERYGCFTTGPLLPSSLAIWRGSVVRHHEPPVGSDGDRLARSLLRVPRHHGPLVDSTGPIKTDLNGNPGGPPLELAWSVCPWQAPAQNGFHLRLRHPKLHLLEVLLRNAVPEHPAGRLPQQEVSTDERDGNAAQEHHADAPEHDDRRPGSGRHGACGSRLSGHKQRPLAGRRVCHNLTE